MQEFKLDKSFKTTIKLSFIFFLALFFSGLCLPFWPGEGESSSDALIVISMIAVLVFGGLTIWAWRTLKNLSHMDIMVDGDGLWLGSGQKEDTLAPWGKIDQVKERLYHQCLDLLDSDGRRLIRVEYQLRDFEILRSLINEKVDLSLNERQGNSFFKKKIYHLFYAGCVLGFSWLGIYVGRSGNTLLGYGAVAVLNIGIMWEYFATIYGIDITDPGLILFFPFRKKQVRHTDILRIEMGDTFNNGTRHPEVWVIVKDRKRPYKLKQLGVDANVLLAVLKKNVTSGTGGAAS